MGAIKLEYTPGTLGPTKIKAGEPGDHEPAPLVDINLGGGVAVEAIINGNSLNPIGALISSPPGEAVAADVAATIKGDDKNPIVANVGATIDGGTTPVTAHVTATIDDPVKLHVRIGDLGLRDTTISFKLFGLFNILTIQIEP